MKPIILRKNGKAYLVQETELKLNKKGEIQWAIFFQKGGWNDIWARTESIAFQRACDEYNSSEHTQVSRVTPMTDELHQSLLRNFH